MVFGFVAQSGGVVRVRTAPGEGATFSLYFPRALERMETPAVAVTPLPGDDAAGETVLAVEDDEGLLRVVERELRELGYDVLTASDGDAALAVLERELVDIVFSDVAMTGGVDGVALAELVRARWPATRVVRPRDTWASDPATTSV